MKLLAMVSRPWFQGRGFKAVVSRPWFQGHGFIAICVLAVQNSTWSRWMRCCTIGGSGLTPGMRTRPAGVICGPFPGAEFAADADADDEKSMRPVSMAPGLSTFRRRVTLNSGILRIGGVDSRSKLAESAAFGANDEEFAGTWSSLIWSTIQDSSSRCLVDLGDDGIKVCKQKKDKNWFSQVNLSENEWITSPKMRISRIQKPK